MKVPILNQNTEKSHIRDFNTEYTVEDTQSKRALTFELSNHSKQQIAKKRIITGAGLESRCNKQLVNV